MCSRLITAILITALATAAARGNQAQPEFLLSDEQIAALEIIRPDLTHADMEVLEADLAARWLLKGEIGVEMELLPLIGLAPPMGPLRLVKPEDFGRELIPGVDPNILAPDQLPREERLIGNDDFVEVRFLRRAVNSIPPVARVILTKRRTFKIPGSQKAQEYDVGTGIATAFLVGPSLILTNNHVIPDRKTALTGCELEFGYEQSLDGSAPITDRWSLDPDSCFFTSEELDFTLVGVRTRPALEGAQPERAGDRHGVAWLEDVGLGTGLGAHILQHPGGEYKRAVINFKGVVGITERYLKYTSDTLPGSSGAPVFNNTWQVIALHRAGGDYDPLNRVWINNQGVRIDLIIEAIRQSADPKVQAARQEMGL